MTFRASNLLPQQGYNNARAIALDLKNYCTSKAASILANGDDAGDILGILAKIRQARDDFNSIKAIPGIAVYAVSQEDDLTYDVVTEFNTLVTLVETAITNLVAAFPRDVNGYLLIATLPVDTLSYRTFTSAQLSFLVTDLTNIANQIT